MKILIIGGTRFMGPFVARQLAAEGHEVTVFHRGKSPANLPEAVRVLHGDRRELPSHAEELRRTQPDVVIDMVAFTESDAQALGEVFRGSAGRLVMISSVDVYREYDRLRGVDTSPSDPMPLSEESPLRDRLFPYRSQAKEGELFYDYEKILIEQAVLSDAELPATVLRLPAVYGPGDGQHRLFPYVKRMDDNRPAILLSEGQAAWRWTRGYVENIAAGIALAATDARATGRIYNVGEEHPLPEAGWVEAIGRAAGWNGTVVRAREEQLPEAMREGMDWSRHLVVCSERIRAELGYQEIVSPEEALSRAIRWERESPPPVDRAQFDYEAEDRVLAIS